MKYSFCLLFFLFFLADSYAQEAPEPPYQTPFEKDNNYSASYTETIKWYQGLANDFPELEMLSIGSTDAGYPLHTAVLSVDQVFDPVEIRKSNKVIILINNAIHPGEPCGVDATMLLYRDLLTQPDKRAQLKNVVLVAIPFYNIGGGLNRSSYSRANQNGPQEYGFRGNAQNLDLNRDFIKCDSKNAQTFNQLFNIWKPQLLVDNHTTNGADYQYSLTLVPPQKDKLHPILANYWTSQLQPQLFQRMAKTGWELCPYVNVPRTPDQGIYGFLDLPRYSSGYAALHHCIGMMPEAHMLKPFAIRVQSTYAFMDQLIQLANRDHAALISNQQKAREASISQQLFPLNWELDTTKQSSFEFKGYAAKYKPSEVTGQERLYYDQNAPYSKSIPYFDSYKASLQARKPAAYLIPQAYEEVIQRLRWNGVQVKRLRQDFTAELEMYYIREYETRNTPYEGHYLHYNTQIEAKVMPWTYRKGDYVVLLDQPTNRYIVEVLEPQAPDSYFSWNFFDGILMQKEYFSSYVFEDLAAELLLNDSQLRAAFEQKKQEDPEFAASAREQLRYIYERSPYYEPTYRLYPVGRVGPTISIPAY